MEHNIYQPFQTIEQWQYTIRKKFSDVSLIKGHTEIANILDIKEPNEVSKIKQALLENYAEKYGLKNIEIKKLHESVPTRFQIEYKLEQIIKTLNGTWEPIYTPNNQQKKWYPYFNLVAGSFRACGYCWYDANSDVGSRLCLETQEQAYFMGNYYLNDYILILKY